MADLRSTLFNILFFGFTAVCCVALLWSLLTPRHVFLAVIRWYLRCVAALERGVLGLDYRVVGREHIPKGAFLVAAKHQSAWETMKLHLLFDDPAIVLKRELMWLPIWGWYAAKADLIPVNRGGRGKAIASIILGGRRMVRHKRPIVIFPQGTRVAPGAVRPYRIGIAALYDTLGIPVVPMALNSGVFWGRRSARKRAGTITVEFLPPIPPGLPRQAFLERLERELETASNRLVVAEGGPATPLPVGAPIDSASPPRTAPAGAI